MNAVFLTMKLILLHRFQISMQAVVKPQIIFQLKVFT